MEFTEVVRNRYSCKNFDAGKAVDAAKLTGKEVVLDLSLIHI